MMKAFSFTKYSLFKKSKLKAPSSNVFKNKIRSKIIGKKILLIRSFDLAKLYGAFRMGFNPIDQNILDNLLKDDIEKIYNFCMYIMAIYEGLGTPLNAKI